MRKKILFIILTILFFFFDINFAFADEKENLNCGKINEKVQNYYYYKEQLQNIDCEKTDDQNIVAMCNDFKIKKNIVVTDLMKLDEEGLNCDAKQEEVNKIIEENEDNCGKIFDDTFSDFVNSIMIAFYIIGPILLILFGSLDFAKATVSSEQDALRKAGKNFAKRVTATILLFLVPTLVNFIISFNVSDKYLSGNAYACEYKYLVYNKKYKITYVPRTNASTNPNLIVGGASSILEAAHQVHSKYELENWHYSLGDGLTSGNIKKATNNSEKATCCATFVASTLYVSGIVSENDLNKINYNSATSISNFLQSIGWKKTNDYESLQPGDIVLMTSTESGGSIGHIQICAGRNSSGSYLWYNAGGDYSIKTINPYPSNARNRFLFALRQ